MTDSDLVASGSCHGGDMDRGSRSRLPKRRPCFRYELTLRTPSEHRKLYVEIGTYPDGHVGEVFVRVAKDGSELRVALDAFAIQASLSMQYGMPANQIAESFRGIKASPGIVWCPEIPELHGQEVHSTWDAVARLLDIETDANGVLLKRAQDIYLERTPEEKALAQQSFLTAFPSRLPAVAHKPAAKIGGIGPRNADTDGPGISSEPLSDFSGVTGPVLPTGNWDSSPESCPCRGTGWTRAIPESGIESVPCVIHPRPHPDLLDKKKSDQSERKDSPVGASVRESDGAP